MVFHRQGEHRLKRSAPQRAEGGWSIGSVREREEGYNLALMLVYERVIAPRLLLTIAAGFPRTTPSLRHRPRSARRAISMSSHFTRAATHSFILRRVTWTSEGLCNGSGSIRLRSCCQTAFTSLTMTVGSGKPRQWSPPIPFPRSATFRERRYRN